MNDRFEDFGYIKINLSQKYKSFSLFRRVDEPIVSRARLIHPFFHLKSVLPFKTRDKMFLLINGEGENRKTGKNTNISAFT